jgi:hypothetical protein
VSTRSCASSSNDEHQDDNSKRQAGHWTKATSGVTTGTAATARISRTAGRTGTGKGGADRRPPSAVFRAGAALKSNR